jgi:flagellar hook assembly protein FlgD
VSIYSCLKVDKQVSKFKLWPPFPNPFYKEIHIVFEVDEQARGSCEILNLCGEVVRRLYNGVFETGRHRLSWDGRDASQRLLSSGVYVVRLRCGRDQKVQKITFMH